jgi:hypothetical protein
MLYEFRHNDWRELKLERCTNFEFSFTALSRNASADDRKWNESPNPSLLYRKQMKSFSQDSVPWAL